MPIGEMSGVPRCREERSGGSMLRGERSGVSRYRGERSEGLSAGERCVS